MKKLIYVSIFFALNPNFSVAQNEQSILNSFKKKVKNVESSFSTSPIILTSQDFPQSSSGKTYYLLKFEKVKPSSYDIQKTNSLVSSYTGYIILTIRVLSNKRSGDVKSKGTDGTILGIHGFENAAKANEVKVFSSCSSILIGNTNNIDEWCAGAVKILYAYQDKVWTFKGVDTEIDNNINNGSTRGDIENGLLNKYFK